MPVGVTAITTGKVKQTLVQFEINVENNYLVASIHSVDTSSRTSTVAMSVAFIKVSQHSIGFYFGVQSVDTGNIDSNVSSWQAIPYVEGYLPISACFVGYYNNGSRWIVSNPMEITDNESRITLVRMFNNNDTVSAAKGDLEIIYIKRSLFENLSQFQQVQQ